MKNLNTIMVPASSANLGSGFDVIGACLNVWNEINFRKSKFNIENIGFGSETLNTTKENLIYRSYVHTTNILGEKEIEVSLKCQNSIPTSGGLGSSSSAVIAGILLAYSVHNIDLDNDDIFQIASDIEGHPDNVGPALYGGITLGFKDLEKWYISNIKFDKNLKIVSFVSDQKILTSESRAALPNTISREDAVYNITRSALLVNSLNTNDFALLKYAFQDKLHEQYRTPEIKGFSTISNAAMNAGAISTYLSGSGPTISAITLGKELTINYEMLDAANKLNLPGNGIISSISEKGAYVLEK
ncbi:MAG: homoserine kinase [Chloroflexi bacterium]|nr:homoserine kinase [Chloroflexota bacterium]MBK90362.1 homoserine kinase [Chloroflexota bacterium]|tara:strand:+ start:8745 stop:9647 length:903 start_codon:yes stop_codon:yes gene_type:complete